MAIAELDLNCCLVICITTSPPLFPHFQVMLVTLLDSSGLTVSQPDCQLDRLYLNFLPLRKYLLLTTIIKKCLLRRLFQFEKTQGLCRYIGNNCSEPNECAFATSACIMSYVIKELASITNLFCQLLNLILYNLQ